MGLLMIIALKLPFIFFFLSLKDMNPSMVPPFLREIFCISMYPVSLPKRYSFPLYMIHTYPFSSLLLKYFPKCGFWFRLTVILSMKDVVLYGFLQFWGSILHE